MEITNIETEEFGVGVDAVSEGKEMGFYVQLTDNKFRSDLGCWITASDSDGDIDRDDYPDFNIDEIVDAAEKHAAAEFKEQYTEKTIDFHCAINSCHVAMRINNETDEVQLVIEDTGYIGDYQRRYNETDVCFESEKDALAFADQFRTGEYQDFSGLHQLMSEINNSY